MAWKYDLGKTATALRSAIYQSDEDADGCLAVLNALRECYAKVKEMLPAEDWDADFEEMHEEMEIIRAYGDESHTFRQRIFHDENGNEFVIDSALPRRDRMTTLCNAAWEVDE